MQIGQCHMKNAQQRTTAKIENVMFAIRRLRTDKNCPAEKSWPNLVKFEIHLRLSPSTFTRWSVDQPITSLLATGCWRDPAGTKQLSTVAFFGFQFGLYHVVVPLKVSALNHCFLPEVGLSTSNGYWHFKWKEFASGLTSLLAEKKSYRQYFASQLKS